MSYLVWLVCSALAFAAGEYISKMYALTLNPKYMVGAMAAYMCGTMMWFPAITQKNHLAVAGTIWSVLSLLGTVAIGTLAFDEKMTRSGWVGVVLAVLSVFLLSRE